MPYHPMTDSLQEQLCEPFNHHPPFYDLKGSSNFNHRVVQPSASPNRLCIPNHSPSDRAHFLGYIPSPLLAVVLSPLRLVPPYCMPRRKPKCAPGLVSQPLRYL